MKATLLFLLGWLVASSSAAQPKPVDLLLLGTFHFHNPGADVAKFKTLDVLTPAAQAQLEDITTRLARFGPRKIFVEWEQKDQAELDTLYGYYRQGPAAYAAHIKARYAAKRHNFFFKNEIVQLAFRAGKKAGLSRIYGFDYQGTNFPYDSVQHALRDAHQDSLRQAIDGAIATVEAKNNRQQATMSLTQLLLAENTPADLTFNKAFYLNKLNRAGSVGNFAGAYLVSEWYRRNLYMYALLQKLTRPTDGRVLVLAGSGHVAMLRDFVPYDGAFRLVPVADVLRK